MHKIFRYPKLSEAPKGSPAKSFGTVRQKTIDKKSCYPPPPLLSIKFFDFRNFLKQKGSSAKIFGTVRQEIPRTKFFSPVRQKFFIKSMIPPPPPSYA